VFNALTLTAIAFYRRRYVLLMNYSISMDSPSKLNYLTIFRFLAMMVVGTVSWGDEDE
jgi:hypothetical protein